MHKRERKKKLILTLKNNAKLREEHSTKVGNEHLTAKTLWGRLVIYLREHNQVILHIVCGDIENVKYDGDTLIISPEQKNVVDLLNEKKVQLLYPSKKLSFSLCVCKAGKTADKVLCLAFSLAIVAEIIFFIFRVYVK